MKKIIKIREEIQIGDVILERGDRVRVIEGNPDSVTRKVKNILDKANFPYANIDTTNYDVTVKIETLSVGSEWNDLENKFFSLFPSANIDGIDIYLEGTL